MVFEYKREPLEENEILALRKACQTFEEELIINVLLETGMRVSEFAKLSDDEISWQRSCITTIGKGNKRRVIPLSKTARFYLTEYFKDNHKIHLSPRIIQMRIKFVADRARIKKPVTPHVLRHTFAVCYLHRGGNVRALQGILGHSSLITTDVYLNYSGQRVIEDFQKVWEQKPEPKHENNLLNYLE
ncbi:MAG: tyrosine-type recombinase/integrase [Candidatus Nanoarchaeia archaeon]